MASPESVWVAPEADARALSDTVAVAVPPWVCDPVSERIEEREAVPEGVSLGVV